MKKVLIINGSPKGEASNSYQLTHSFIEGIQTVEGLNPEIEIIDLNQAKIAPCKGCFGCWTKMPGRCVLHDDMEEILPKLVEADLLVFSFPLYYFSVPGPLKTFFDRQLPLSLPFMKDREDGIGNGGHPRRYDRSHQRVVAISTCGFYTAKDNYGAVERMFDHCFSKDRWYGLFCGQGELFRVPELKNQTQAYLDVVKQAGNQYGQGLLLGLAKPEEEISKQVESALHKDILPKQVFESLADASWQIEETGPDGKTKTASGALAFTRQMAALYNPKSYPGHDLVFDMDYTDLGERYQIVLQQEGSRVIIDPAHFQTPEMVVSTTFTIWKQIAAGEIRGDEALMKGMYSVSGSPAILMQWGTYFTPDLETEQADEKADASQGMQSTTGHNQAGSNPKSARKGSKWTNMLVFLLPFTLLWALLNNPPIECAAWSLVGLALIAVFFYPYKKTIYDILAMASNLVLNAMYLLGVSYPIVFSLSLLLFGVFWTFSCLPGQIPLCAWYSSGNFGREDAFKNPIFMKTNWIIALGWGICYLVLAACAWILMGSGQKDLALILAYTLPAGMGIFTIWFQRWYPNYVMLTAGKAKV